MNKTIVFAVVASVLSVAGCSGSAGDPEGASPTAPLVPPASTQPVVDVPPCPNPHGGSCLGPLEPGEYQTATFAPQLTYTVPAGWTNDEDLPGNFLLHKVEDPQGNRALGGSYLGIFTNVHASPLTCEETWDDDIGSRPKDLVRWYQSVPGWILSKPKKVTVGGLDGLQIDLSLEPGVDTCTFGKHDGLPLFIGDGVSQVFHSSIDGLNHRLVILGWQDGNVTLEITNVEKQHSAKEYRAQVQPIIDSMEFQG